MNYKLYRNILVTISYDPISLSHLCNVYVIVFVGGGTNMVHCMTYNSSYSDEQESDGNHLVVILMCTTTT